MIASVTRRSEFAALRSNSSAVRHGVLRLRFAPPPAELGPASSYQLAFAINRKFGTAVERNRARRRLKAAFSMKIQSEVDRPPLGLYLLLPSRGVLSSSHQDILNSLEACLKRVTAGA